MTNMLPSGIEMDSRLLKIGGGLATGGMLLTTAGLALASIAVTKAVRAWVNQMENPPGAIAQSKLQQVRSASMAGMQAWRDAAPAGVGASANGSGAKR